MQQINFSPIDFSRVPQREEEARRRQYQAISDLANSVAKGAEMWEDAHQRELAEEWKRKEWERQNERDKIADARYAAEIARRDAMDEASRNAAEQLRQEFLGRMDGMDLSKYGAPAQFAMTRIQNARDWNDIVSAGESLANIIQYQDALNAQSMERAASAAEQERQMAGPRLSQRIGSEMAASGLDLGNLNDVYRSTPRASRQATLDQLRAYRDQLVQFQTENPGMLTPEMQKQLNDINQAIRVWGRRMGARPVSF